ncbi:MAG: TauD/TfdA family dioxygenase [Alphaproteobacteria bacterium]
MAVTQMPGIAASRVECGADTLRIAWSDGHDSVFHAIWLRDNCPCTGCRHPENDQRLFDITAIPLELGLADATVGADGLIAVSFAPDGHEARFDPRWLRAHSYSDPARGERRPAPRLWGRELEEAPPVFDHAEVSTDPRALARWLRALAAYGFAMLENVPLVPEEVTRVAELFGFVRETNYGRFFDVRSVARPINLAYTGMGLPVHTDNPYRDPVPGLQLVHCLEADADGGESVVTDGFHVAEVLKREAPGAFELLTRHAVPFRFHDAGTDLEARAPLIALDDLGRVTAVRYNNRSAAPFDVPAEVMPDFYAAYRRFAEILQRPALEVGFRMGPGDLFAVDNRRVLHGRKAFAATGRRHLQACYADWDGLLSTLHILEAREE